MRVIGAGLPRTGTSSLREMLDRLLSRPCYHMKVLYGRVETDGEAWMAALRGDLAALDPVFDGFDAAVDWPASILWRELADRYPDALVVLSHRGSSERWWKSADATVWEVMRQVRDGDQPEHVPGIHHLMRDLAGFDHEMEAPAAQRRYDEHIDEVVAEIPADRLLVWDPAEGWGPLCDRLGVPVPEVEAPRTNTSEQFRDRMMGSAGQGTEA